MSIFAISMLLWVVPYLDVAVGGAVLANDGEGLRWGPARSTALHDQFVGGAGVPAHPDADSVRVLLQQQCHVGDQCAQQPLPVAGLRRRRVPQSRQVRGQRAQRVVVRHWGFDGSGGRKRRLCRGQGSELGLPPRFQSPRDEAVVGLHLHEGALSPVGFVAGPVDGEFGGAVGAYLPIGDLVRRGQGDLDLLRGDGLQQQVVVDGVGGDGSASGGRIGALVGDLAVGPAESGAHPAATRAAHDDALTQRGALAHRPGARAGSGR
ncbi:hypothetical protein ACFOOK_02790 [Micromonospora krabiensis]|uniref:hypothetical protein n=1 Tax=Micromonospora krabiensis TaxID=307121 RepID=UPI001E570E34|nr:hypothetical protein [Micromonospora krabiensis]